MDAWGEGVREIEVEDPGVLLDTNTKMDYESLLAYEKDRQKRGELAFRASISLSREEECFSALTADFWRQLLRVVQCSVPVRSGIFLTARAGKCSRSRRRSWESSF